MQSTRSSRLSLGSNTSGSRRHSLLSTDGNLPIESTQNYAKSWSSSAPGDRLSQWRRTYIASENGDTEGVQSTSLALPDETRFTTCLAMSDDQPLLAVGSGSYETNMFFVQSLDDQLDVKASFASKFPIYSLVFKSNLLMAGTDRNTSVLYKVDRARLLGYSEPDNNGEGPLVRCVGTFKNKAAKSIDIAAPGNHAPTKRISCVEFAPAFASTGDSQQSGWPPASGAELFLSCLGGVVNIWDVSRSQHALRMEKVSNQPLTRAAWSPLAPANLVAASGTDGVVNILDLRRRGKAIAWRTALPTGHDAWLGEGCVNDVAWSPFVPYWLATAGETGEVSIWDLRYAASDGAAVATLRHPTNHGSTRSLAWSPTHIDMLATGTSDRSWWLHALRVGEENEVAVSLVADRRAAEDIGSVVAVRAKGSTFYTLSSCGDLYAHRVTQSALGNVAVRQQQGGLCERAEAAVYARDVKLASECVLELLNSFSSGVEQRMQQLSLDPKHDAESTGHPVVRHADKIKELCDLFKAKPRLTHASWALPPPSVALMAGSTLADGQPAEAESAVPSAVSLAHQHFASDLKYLGHGLPPDFPLEAVASRHPVVWQALERLNMASLRIKLANMVEMAEEPTDGEGKKKAGSPVGSDGRPLWKNIADREKQIIQYVMAEPSLFGPKLLRSVVKLILPHDCIAGLSLGLGVCQAYLHHERQQSTADQLLPVSCTLLDGLVHVLLFPTVFDTDTSTVVDAQAPVSRSIVAADVHTVRERIRECLAACPEAVFEMVKLEIAMQKIVLGGGEQAKVAEDIVRAVREHAERVRKLLASGVQLHPDYPATTTLSASAVRLYLNSLVPMRAYDEYLVNTQWWRVAPPQADGDAGHVVGNDHGWLSSFPLAQMLVKQTATLVVPRFQRQINVVLSTIRKEPLSLEPRLYRDTLLKVARVGLMLREPLQDLPFAVLEEAFDEIGNAFLMLLEALTRHSSHRDAFKRAASEALPLCEAFGALLGGKGIAVERNNSSRVLVVKYLRKLEHYANSAGAAVI